VVRPVDVMSMIAVGNDDWEVVPILEGAFCCLFGDKVGVFIACDPGMGLDFVDVGGCISVNYELCDLVEQVVVSVFSHVLRAI